MAIGREAVQQSLAPGPDPVARVRPPLKCYADDARSKAFSSRVERANAAGFNHILFSPVGTDAYNFNLAGIPASGLLTGQNCCKTQEEVDLFGGYLGNYEGNVPSFDGGCVDNPFRWCDNLSNVDPSNLELMSKAFANTVIRMAFDTTVMSASHSIVNKKHLPTTGQKGARLVSQ